MVQEEKSPGRAARNSEMPMPTSARPVRKSAGEMTPSPSASNLAVDVNVIQTPPSIFH